MIWSVTRLQGHRRPINLCNVSFYIQSAEYTAMTNTSGFIYHWVMGFIMVAPRGSEPEKSQKSNANYDRDMSGILNRYRLLKPNDNEQLCLIGTLLRNFEPFMTSIVLVEFEMLVISTKCKKRRVRRSKELFVDYFYQVTKNRKFGK